eukprot:Clim_evm54s88 gene=Clim_evmTU54s88
MKQIVVVGYDFESSAERCVHYIQNHLTECAGTTIYLIHVSDGVTHHGGMTAEDVQAKLNQIALRFKDEPIEVNPIVAEGDPRETLCQFASDVKATSMLVGTGSYDVDVLGPVPTYLLAKAPCPVMVARSLTH